MVEIKVGDANMRVTDIADKSLVKNPQDLKLDRIKAPRTVPWVHVIAYITGTVEESVRRGSKIREPPKWVLLQSEMKKKGLKKRDFTGGSNILKPED